MTTSDARQVNKFSLQFFTLDLQEKDISTGVMTSCRCELGSCLWPYMPCHTENPACGRRIWNQYTQRRSVEIVREKVMFLVLWASLLWLLFFGGLIVQLICEIFLYPPNKSPCKFVWIVLLSIAVFWGGKTENIACTYPVSARFCQPPSYWGKNTCISWSTQIQMLWFFWWISRWRKLLFS